MTSAVWSWNFFASSGLMAIARSVAVRLGMPAFVRPVSTSYRPIAIMASSLAIGLRTSQRVVVQPPALRLPRGSPLASVVRPLGAVSV